MEDLVVGAPQPEDPKGPTAPGQRGAPIIHTREGERTAPVKPLNKIERKPLSRRVRIALGFLAAIIGIGGILWTASTAFPSVRDEIIANTALRCTATPQCVPIGAGACWNKGAAGIRAVFRKENPIAAMNPSASSSCACSEGLCEMKSKATMNYPGYVPPPGN